MALPLGVRKRNEGMIRIAFRPFTIPDYFISYHNRGKLVNEEDWNEYLEAKELFRIALEKFQNIYDKKKEQK